MKTVVQVDRDAQYGDMAMLSFRDVSLCYEPLRTLVTFNNLVTVKILLQTPMVP